MRVPILAGTMLAALAGCSRHDGAIRVDDDTYRVVVDSATAAAAAHPRELALSKAHGKCAALGRDVEIVDVRGDSPPGATTVVFRCRAHIHR